MTRWRAQCVLILILLLALLISACSTSGEQKVCVVLDTGGENDRRYRWFGAAGLLRREDHVELLAMDWETGETTRIVTDDVRELTGSEVAR